MRAMGALSHADERPSSRRRCGLDPLRRALIKSKKMRSYCAAITSAVKRVSNSLRHAAREVLSIFLTAFTRSSNSLAMMLLTPLRKTSGTEPQGRATTGVPQASASIIARPNGSGQSIVNIRASALPRKSFFCASLISPMYSTPGKDRRGLMTCSK